MQLAVLDSNNPEFPDPNTALDDPDGLLAVGGNLQPETLLSAYYQGIFPWYNDRDPILWWSPKTRCVIKPEELHIAKSLKKLISRQSYSVTFNHSFQSVIKACSRCDTDEDTWINQEMIDAYSELHRLGKAHSVEVWRDQQLIGGAYGISVGAVFCGESMFSTESNASKVALVHLSKYIAGLGFKLIDCQFVTNHLLTMGARSLERHKFLKILNSLRNNNIDFIPTDKSL